MQNPGWTLTGFKHMASRSVGSNVVPPVDLDITVFNFQFLGQFLHFISLQLDIKGAAVSPS